MQAVRKGLTLAGIVALLGCAAEPVPSEYYGSVAKQLAPKHGLLLVSSCPIRDEIGQDYLIVSLAAVRTDSMRYAAQSYLASYGLQPSAAPIRMMCAGYQPGANEKLLAIPSKKEKDKAEPASFPYVFHSESLHDPDVSPETAANLQALFDEVHLAPESHVRHEYETPVRTRLELAPEKIRQIRATTGADYIWALATDSVEVSSGKKIGTAVLTAVLTLGFAASMPQGGGTNTVALIDLVEGSIVWKKVEGTLNGMVTATSVYTGGPSPLIQSHSTGQSAPLDWSARLFAPLLAPGQGFAGQGVQAAAPPSSPTPATPDVAVQPIAAAPTPPVAAVPAPRPASQ